MGFFNRICKIIKKPFSFMLDKNKEKQAIDPLDIIVDKYLKNEHIDIPLVPQFIEKHIYRSLLSCVFNILEEKLDSFRANQFGHAIYLDFSPQIIHSLQSTSRGRRVHAIDKSTKKYIETLVKTFLESEQASLTPFPKSVDQALLQNVIFLVYAIFEDVIRSTSFKFMGRRITLNFRDFKKECPDIQSNSNNVEVKRIEEAKEKFKDREPIIDRLVQDIMEKNNILVIPDFMERHFYKTSLTLLMFFMSKIMKDAQVDIMFHTITFNMELPCESKENNMA